MTEINVSNLDIARAWKDEDYRNSLTEAQRASLPSNPAGTVDLDDSAISSIHGGRFTDGFDIPTINDGGICIGNGWTGPDPYPKEPTNYNIYRDPFPGLGAEPPRYGPDTGFSNLA